MRFATVKVLGGIANKEKKYFLLRAWKSPFFIFHQSLVGTPATAAEH